MIYDTFLYFGTDTDRRLLALRLAELSPVVDRFVLVEATITHSGQEKPLYYRDHHSSDPAIAPYRDRIIAVAVDDLPANASPLTRENVQRAAIELGLQSCNPDDWVLVSDLDELPSRDGIQRVVAANHDGIHQFAQRLSYYYLNCHADKQPWFGTRMMRRSQFSTPQTVRHVSGHVVHNAGWHMSYLGGVAQIQQKIAAYLHQEFNTPEITAAEHIARCLAEGRDLFGRADQTYTVRPVDRTYPETILAHPEQYRDWFAPEQQSTSDGANNASNDTQSAPSDAKRPRGRRVGAAA